MGKAPWLGLVFFGLLAFGNAIRHPFVHDDVIFILKNPHITQLNHWTDAFQPSLTAEGLNTYYRPVLEIINRLEYRLFGSNPWGFHFCNIIIHVVNGLLLFSLLKKLALSETVSWVVALFFLIHPVQTEAVSCISGISNLWMALLLLLGLHAWVDRRYAPGLFYLVIAFFSKEQALMFLPLVLVIDYALKRKNDGWWTAALVTGVVLLWIRHIITGSSLLKDVTASHGELFLRMAAVGRDLWMYLHLIFFPYDLHYYRSTDILQPNAGAWMMWVLLGAITGYILWRWPKTRWTAFLGLGWFLAALSPVLNIVPLINEYSLILTPEHFVYLPMVGILIMVVIAGEYFLKAFKVWILGLLILICLLTTWHQNRYWQSEVALFERMIRYEPDFGRGHWLLAKAYAEKGDAADAESHFQKSYQIFSGYAAKATNLTAKNFYLRYMNDISLQRSRLP